MAVKRMKKTIEEDCVVIAVIDGAKESTSYDFNTLPETIQEKLGPFGLSHKLGDAAAGKSGVEAEEAIDKVFAGLMEGNWAVRAAATPKVSTKVIADNFTNLSEAEQDAAREVLIALGIAIPGISK
jgi:hypothetical protein